MNRRYIAIALGLGGLAWWWWKTKGDGASTAAADAPTTNKAGIVDSFLARVGATNESTVNPFQNWLDSLKVLDAEPVDEHPPFDGFRWDKLTGKDSGKVTTLAEFNAIDVSKLGYPCTFGYDCNPGDPKYKAR